MNDQQQQHVFISYVRENQKLVDRLCQELESHGANVWLDRNSINPGARWKDAIREAIRHGDFFIACFSNEYTSKEKTYMNEELTLAIEELRKYPTDRVWFIPVLLSECDVPARSIGAGETLLDINWVPLYEDWDAGIQRILSVIKPIPLRVQNLINALCSEDGDVRESAAMALARIGPEAKAAVSALIEALEDEEPGVFFESEEALVKIGPEAVPTLTEAIKNKDVRRRAVDILRKISPEAVPALIKALKCPDSNVRWDAAEALQEIGSEALPTLVRALKDKNEDHVVRWRAVEVLGRIGQEAIPPLIKTLKGGDPKIYWPAVQALGNIGPEAKAAVPVLIEALRDQGSKDIHKATAQALEKINTPEALKALEEYMEKSNITNHGE